MISCQFWNHVIHIQLSAIFSVPPLLELASLLWGSVSMCRYMLHLLHLHLALMLPVEIIAVHTVFSGSQIMPEVALSRATFGCRQAPVSDFFPLSTCVLPPPRASLGLTRRPLVDGTLAPRLQCPQLIRAGTAASQTVPPTAPRTFLYLFPCVCTPPSEQMGIPNEPNSQC